MNKSDKNNKITPVIEIEKENKANELKQKVLVLHYLKAYIAKENGGNR